MFATIYNYYEQKYTFLRSIRFWIADFFNCQQNNLKKRPKAQGLPLCDVFYHQRTLSLVGHCLIIFAKLSALIDVEETGQILLGTHEQTGSFVELNPVGRFVITGVKTATSSSLPLI